MQTVSGGKLVVQSLVAEGVRHVFGLIGSAGMEIFDALVDESSIRFIGVRDERTGTHMADGYARASGGTGVIIAGQNGPGVTNLVTGLAQAQAAFSPVVAIAGLLSSGHQYRDAFQEVDQTSLLKPVTKRTVAVPSAERIPELMRDAFRTSLAPRRGPVAVNIARDVLSQSCSMEAPLQVKGRQFDVPAGVASEALEAARRVLQGARQPLILAGGGIKNGRHGDEVLRLAELLNCPVAMSPGHGDAISSDVACYAGQVGPRGNIVATDLMRTADVILALGTRIGFNSTFYTYDHLNPQAQIIQVESDALAIGRFFPVALGVIADPGIFTRELCRMLADHKPGPELQSWMSSFVQKRREMLATRDAQVSNADRIQPWQLYRAIRGMAPRDSAYTMDAGTLCLQATDSLHYRTAPSLFTPLDFGLVGFSYACGLGVKLAMPDRHVISLMGDGGFGMTTSELGTAASHGIATICIVMNNGCWGAEKAYQRDFFGGRYLGADIPNPPYDELARLWGVRGYRATSIAAFERAFADALTEDKPAVIDVAVDPDALFSFRRDSFQHRVKG